MPTWTNPKILLGDLSDNFRKKVLAFFLMNTISKHINWPGSNRQGVIWTEFWQWTMANGRKI